jgi:signal transduction histidine kinase
MGRLKKLLNRTLKTFTLYALIVLTASIPAYYYLVDSIWLAELDEHNEIIAERTEQELNRLKLSEPELALSIQLWNKIQPGTNLQAAAATGNKSDSTYILLRRNVYAENEEIDRFRGLSRFIHINGKPYRLTVETNVEESEETVIAIAGITFLFFLILVVGFLLLNRRLSTRLWQPFRTTLEKLKSFNLNSQDQLQFDQSDTLEFEELNTALTRLIEKNISVFKTQKEFTENASHELQTPLAIIKSKLALLLQSQTLTDQQYEIIEEINKSLTRVSRINKNLLLLAKIENQQFANREEINLSQLINESLALLKDFADNKNIKIETETSGEVIMAGNRILVELLINNLLMNAIRHNSENGEIWIRLTGDQLLVSNSGKTALDNERIFKRFSKLSNEKSGSGLGLALVKEICNRYNWAVSYQFRDHAHHFTVQL